MLEIVDARVLERRVEERREVGPPHRPPRTAARRRPGRSRARGPAASGGSAGSRAAGRRAGRRRRSERDRRADRAISGAATRVSRTCWTMWTENSVVSYVVDARTWSANAIATSPPRNASGPRPRHGVGRDGRAFTRRTSREPGDRRADERQQDQRLERPAEQEVGDGRRLGRHRTVGEHRRRDGEPGDERGDGHRARHRAGPAGGHGRWAMKPGETGRHPIIVARSPGSARERDPGRRSARRSGYAWTASGRAFGPWPSAEPSVLSPGARPRAGGADRDRGRPMSSHPGSRPSSGTILVWLVAVVVVVLRRRPGSS